MTIPGNLNTPSAGVRIDFEHWHCELSAAQLRKYGSPHFDRKTIGQELARVVEARATRLANGVVSVDRDQIIAANHAYPEAAVVDPLADLELWEEWRLGIREFPYLGQYAPLGLFGQDIKTSSPSSVGVVGEIVAGLIAESLVARTILVRVIRRWPDFILFPGPMNGKNIFAFVESKAVGPNSDPQRHVFHGRVPEPLFWDAAVDAIQQLNADSLVDVWGAFTWVKGVVPFEMVMTFIHFRAPDERRNAFPSTDLPVAVLNGIAERAVGAVISELSDEERQGMMKRRKRATDSEFRDDVILRDADEQFDKVVAEELVAGPIRVNDKAKRDGLRIALSRLNREAELYGRRFREAKEAPDAAVKFVGSVGGRAVYMAGLSVEDRAALRQDWAPTWRRAFEPWKTRDGMRFWRAGGALFAVEE